jgi:hypothetical protein
MTSGPQEDRDRACLGGVDLGRGGGGAREKATPVGGGGWGLVGSVLGCPFARCCKKGLFESETAACGCVCVCVCVHAGGARPLLLRATRKAPKRPSTPAARARAVPFWRSSPTYAPLPHAHTPTHEHFLALAVIHTHRQHTRAIEVSSLDRAAKAHNHHNPRNAPPPSSSACTRGPLSSFGEPRHLSRVDQARLEPARSGPGSPHCFSASWGARVERRKNRGGGGTPHEPPISRLSQRTFARASLLRPSGRAGQSDTTRAARPLS